MRKAPLLLAAVTVALFSAILSSNLEARSAHRKKAAHKQSQARGAAHKQSRARARHAATSPRHAHRARARQAARSRRPHPVITQDSSGKVVLDRFPAPPVYGPFYPGSLQIYPEPLCEPIDAVVEARIHEPEGTAEGEGEPAEAAGGELRAAAPAGERASLSRIAEKIGSFFRPKSSGAAVIEAHVHEPEGTTEGEGEPAEAVGGEPQTAVPAGERASLSRIAEKVGSFFRPKSSGAVVKPADVDLGQLLSAGFQIPVAGVDAAKLQDSFLSSRGRHTQHLAIDIGAPRGTSVVATTDGEIVRISRERRGGRSIYQKDASGQYLLFYCHLSRYADGLAPGQKVKKGEVIGYVGSSGHVIGGSHLHFSITKLPQDDSSFKRGLAINPYLLFLAGVP